MTVFWIRISLEKLFDTVYIIVFIDLQLVLNTQVLTNYPWESIYQSNDISQFSEDILDRFSTPALSILRGMMVRLHWVGIHNQRSALC